MSFDLYFFDLDDVPGDEDALIELLEDDTRWSKPPTRRLAAFVGELTVSYPSLDDDPDGSPWAGWPLGDTMVDGHCVGVGIVWSQAEAMSEDLRARAQSAGLTLYDPQESLLLRPETPPLTAASPEPAPTRRRWWKRRP